MYFDANEFGQRVSTLRKARGLSQEKLAEQMNISRSHLSHMEIGKVSPSLDLLIELAEFFRVSLDYLIVGKQEKDYAKEKEKLKKALYLLNSMEIE